MIEKITDADLTGKGVVGQPDVPGLSALEMQNKVEEIPRSVIIPAYNAMVDDLQSPQAGSGAANVGSAPIDGLDGETVQAKLEAAKAILDQKVASELIKKIRINGYNQMEYTYDGTNFFPISADESGTSKVPYVLMPQGQDVPILECVPNTLYFATLEAGA